MREPRPVMLTEAELRALRMIDEALDEEDPGLAGLLDGRTDVVRWRRARRLVLTYIVVSVVGLVSGLATDDPGILGLGLLLLLLIPVVTRCAQAVHWWL